MEQMTEQEFQAWIQAHRGERGRKPYYESKPVLDIYGNVDHVERTLAGTSITANDGATITVARTPDSGQPNRPDYTVVERMEPEPEHVTPRTPDQQRSDAAQATTAEVAAAAAKQSQSEAEWNANPANIPYGASGNYEDHATKAARIQKEREQARLDQQEQDRIDAAKRAADAQREANAIAQSREQREAATASATTEISRGNLTLAQQREQREAAQANRPQVLPSDTKAPKITQYNPVTGQIESMDNPNYDPVKAAAEEKRQELASQIAARQINLEEAKQQYSQWFDTNVKTPLMLAQEQRAKAEEQRAALDAEERRRQFAATFGLQKADLGQRAAATAIQAEESLLPYRAGPNEAAHMSDAINGLAAGGIVGGPSAGAGIHFSGDDFQFNAPDFKKIAAEATKAVLSGLTDYRPSNDKYQTADYSGVPAVNLSGMPSYSYGGGGGLPAPSPGADQPTQ